MKRFCWLCRGAWLLALMGCAPLQASPKAAPLHFEGKVYQVDTIFNNVDVIMPDRTRTLWADATSQVRVAHHRAQLIDIAMGDQVSGTYLPGPGGRLRLMTIEDATR